MKTFAFLAGACLLAFFVIGPTSAKRIVNETLNGGTLKGVESCVAYSQSELISAETTRNACVERFQVNYYDESLASGIAGPLHRPDGIYLKGTLKNETSGHVTTWVKLRFHLFDADGKETKFETETFIWIEPNSTADFLALIPDLKVDDLRQRKFCEDDDEAPKSCYSWSVIEIKGIKI